MDSSQVKPEQRLLWAWLKSKNLAWIDDELLDEPPQRINKGRQRWRWKRIVREDGSAFIINEKAVENGSTDNFLVTQQNRAERQAKPELGWFGSTPSPTQM